MHTNGLERPASLVDILHWRALDQPDRRAYTFLGDGETVAGELTYGALDRQARQIAAQLSQIAAVGDRALLLYPPGLEYIAAFFGCLYAGMIAVPAYPSPSSRAPTRLQTMLADADIRLIMTTPALLNATRARLDDVSDAGARTWIATGDDTSDATGWQPPALHRDALAFLQYTSGSTAAPKGVMISHANLLHNLEQIQRCFGSSAESQGVIWLPPYHDMGLIGGILQPLYAGFPVTLMPPLAFLQRPLRWMEAVSRYSATISGGPSFAYDLCLQKISDEQRAQLDLSYWQVAFNGAEPVRSDVMERFTTAFAACGFRHTAFYPCYGLAEATLIVSGGARNQPPVVQSFAADKLEQGRALPGR